MMRRTATLLGFLALWAPRDARGQGDDAESPATDVTAPELEAEPAPNPADPAPNATAPEAEVTDPELDAALAADTRTLGTAPNHSEPSAEAPLPAGSPPVPASSMNPEISAILDVALAYFSEDDDLQTGAHDPTANGFNFQQLELAIGSIVDPYFRFDANLVFSQFGVEVEEAYGTTLSLPWGLQSRFGQFLHRFGRLNPTHPHAWDFVDQPFVLGRVFGGEGGRGLGVEASWLTPLPWYVELVVTGMQADGEATARSFYGGESPGVESPRDLLYIAALEQFFPLGDDGSALWGLSAALGPNPTGRDNRTDVYGTDLYLEYRPITQRSQLRLGWQSEVLLRRRQLPAELLQDVGLYSQLVFHWSRHWAVAGRYELGTAADGVNTESPVDPLDPEWTETRQRFTANLTHRPTEFSRFRLQGSHDLPSWRDQGIWAAFLAVELVVGAHGAHNF